MLEAYTVCSQGQIDRIVWVGSWDIVWVWVWIRDTAFNTYSSLYISFVIYLYMCYMYLSTYAIILINTFYLCPYLPSLLHILPFSILPFSILSFSMSLFSLLSFFYLFASFCNETKPTTAAILFKDPSTYLLPFFLNSSLPDAVLGIHMIFNNSAQYTYSLLTASLVFILMLVLCLSMRMGMYVGMSCTSMRDSSLCLDCRD